VFVKVFAKMIGVTFSDGFPVSQETSDFSKLFSKVSLKSLLISHRSRCPTWCQPMVRKYGTKEKKASKTWHL